MAFSNYRSDTEILELVSKCIDNCPPNKNWADRLDSYLSEHGVNIAIIQPDGSDPAEMVILADGRSVWFTHPQMEGPYRYTIAY